MVRAGRPSWPCRQPRTGSAERPLLVTPAGTAGVRQLAGLVRLHARPAGELVGEGRLVVLLGEVRLRRRVLRVDLVELGVGHDASCSHRRSCHGYSPTPVASSRALPAAAPPSSAPPFPASAASGGV